MKKISIKTGRVVQKEKTKSTILKVAKELLRKEKSITLDDVAAKANISRATIYRYYSNVDLLTMEASLEISHKSPDDFYEEVKEKNFEDRILYIQEQYNTIAQQNETVFRRYLSSVLAESITSKEKLRGARRVTSLTKALRSFENEVDGDVLTKLTHSASVLMGIDALIVCKDVCNLDNQEANETLQWTLKMILKGIKS